MQDTATTLIQLMWTVHISAVLLPLCGEQNAGHSHNLNTANLNSPHSLQELEGNI